MSNFVHLESMLTWVSCGHLTRGACLACVKRVLERIGVDVTTLPDDAKECEKEAR